MRLGRRFRIPHPPVIAGRDLSLLVLLVGLSLPLNLTSPAAGTAGQIEPPAAHAATPTQGIAGSASSAVVTYKTTFNGEPVVEEGTTVVTCGQKVARAQTVHEAERLPNAPVETAHLDFESRTSWRTALFQDGSRCSVPTPFDSLPALEVTESTAEILGYQCEHATTIIRSNRIEVWYTRTTGVVGSPVASLVMPGALILRVVRNGNWELTAERVDIGGSDPADPLMPPDWGEIVDPAGYRALVTAALVTTVTVFERERISFDPEITNPDTTETDAVYRYSGGTVILRKVELPRLDDALLFAELVEVSAGDAYDRTGSVFLIPREGRPSFLDALRRGVDVLPAVEGRDGRTYQGVVSMGDYQPPLELIRFITPFGVAHYNEQVRVAGVAWEDSAVYRMDLTELLPVLQGEVWIGAFIGNYDRGGHLLSLRFHYHPNRLEVADTPTTRHWVRPLFNTVNVMEMSGQEYGRIFGTDSLTVEFDLPPGVKDVRLRVLTTGHGGWEGGDEFNPKRNEILLDGRLVAGFVPWRSDCSTFRRLNPASGNFWNGVSSSDFSRSGWCPGTTVNPVTIPLPGLTPGRHRIRVAIDLGPMEGGSFSAWNVSGVVLGEY